MLKISLTDAVAENDGQDHGDPHRRQGRALPGAVLGWLLELESPSGQRVSGQRACWGGVNRPRCHGVTRGGSAEERCRSRARFKKKMPAEERGKSAAGYCKDATKTDKMQFRTSKQASPVAGGTRFYSDIHKNPDFGGGEWKSPHKNNNFQLALLQLALY